MKTNRYTVRSRTGCWAVTFLKINNHDHAISSGGVGASHLAYPAGSDSRLCSRFTHSERLKTTCKDRDGAVCRLLADSPYMREAGLDWREHYSAMMEDVNY